MPFDYDIHVRKNSPAGGECQIHSTHAWCPIRVSARTRRSRCRPAPIGYARPVSPRPAGSRKRAGSDGTPAGGHFSDMVNRNARTADSRDRRRSPHPSALCSDGRRSIAGSLGPISGCRVHCGRSAAHGAIRPGGHSGLARRPNSGNMERPWCRRRDLPSQQLARDQEHRLESGTGFAPAPAFQVRAQGLLARCHELRQ